MNTGNSNDDQWRQMGDRGYRKGVPGSLPVLCWPEIILCYLCELIFDLDGAAGRFRSVNTLSKCPTIQRTWCVAKTAGDDFSGINRGW